jgi:hypothetical protein
MKIPRLLLAVICLFSSAPAWAGVLPLDVRSDGDSAFYEYFSDGFFRMDLPSPTKPANQSFHSISDPSVIYNQNFDGFPNDAEFRFGSVVYDESGLANGTGSAPVTQLTFNMAADPDDPAYLNWRRFTTNTLVDNNSVSGEVELVDGKPIGLTLSAGFQFEAVGWLGATMTGYYPGTLEFSGDQFSLSAEGMPVLDTVFGTGPFHLKWDLSGRLKTLVPSAGDYLDDVVVDGAVFLKWQSRLGQSVATGSDADGDGDGTIGGGDLSVWKDNYGFGVRSAATAVGVPEPGVTIQALAVVLFAASCSRRSMNISFLRR